MGRPPKMFRRPDRDGFWTKKNGVFHNLGTNETKARKEFMAIHGSDEPPSANMRVADLLFRYLEWSKVNHAPTTHKRIKPNIESFSQSLRPGLRLSKLQPSHLTNWLDKRCPKQPPDGSKPVSDNTRHDYASDVLGAFTWAAGPTQRIIPYSPLHGYVKPPKTPRAIYLVPEQYEALMALSHDEVFDDLLAFMRHTGCRPQEVRIICAKDVMLGERLVRIEKKLAKGKKKERKILLNEEALAILQRLVLKHPEGPLFRNSRGRPWTKDAINSRFYRRKEKLPFRATAYTMRHTFATEALKNGAGEAATAAMMGHEDKSMVVKTYGHVDQCEDYLRECLNKATIRAKRA